MFCDYEEQVVAVTSCIKWYQSKFNSGYGGLQSARAGSTLYVKVYGVSELVQLCM